MTTLIRLEIASLAQMPISPNCSRQPVEDLGDLETIILPLTEEILHAAFINHFYPDSQPETTDQKLRLSKSLSQLAMSRYSSKLGFMACCSCLFLASSTLLCPA